MRSGNILNECLWEFLRIWCNFVINFENFRKNVIIWGNFEANFMKSKKIYDILSNFSSIFDGIESFFIICLILVNILKKLQISYNLV